MLEMRLADMVQADTYTTEHFQFNFCSKLVEGVPGLLNVNGQKPSNDDSAPSTAGLSTNYDFEGFENVCDDLRHHAEAFSDPSQANDLDLCHHLEDALKIRFAVGLPPSVTKDSSHFCAWFVDQVFPSEIEPPCMLFMEKLQYTHALNVNGKFHEESESKSSIGTLISSRS